MRAKPFATIPRFVILLTMILSSCQTTPTLTPDQTRQVSLLVGLTGATYVKREGWKDYYPIGFGTMIYPTDLLRTDGEAQLLCADLKAVKDFSGIGRNPCPLSSSDHPLSYDEMLFVSGPRGAPSTTIPYVLYPRNTLILEPRPVFRWNDTQAASYTVEIWQGEDMVWQQTHVPQNEVTYDSNAPELQAGKDYLLIIKDDDTGKSSAMDPNKGLGFQVLGDEQRSEIENKQHVISSLADLSPAAQKLALAIHMDDIQIGSRGLWGDTSNLLVEVSRLQPDSPAIHLRLGDALFKMKLWAEAQSEYEMALAQAKGLNDLESQADALSVIGRLMNDPSRFDQAVALYEDLGAQDKADALRQESGQ